MFRLTGGPREEDSLGRYFAELSSSRHQDSRLKAAQDLRLFVDSEVRDLSTEGAAKFLDDLTNRVFDLVNSADVHEKLGGIAVIDELIEVSQKTSETNETMIIRFANAFRILFQQSTSHSDPVVLAMASKALGHLARAGGALTVEFVEFQIKQSLEWLQADRNERRHLAAVLVLRELAQNTPSLFNVYVDDFLEHIWVALRDPKEEIREAAVEALRVCLRDIAKRGRDWRVACYAKLFAEAQVGFHAKKQSVQAIHASLLCVGELLNITPFDFMAEKFSSVCEYVLRYKENSNALIVRTVISLIPRLAALAPQQFSRLYLTVCLDYLIEQMKDTNRDIAFLALGELAMAVGDAILPQLETIVQHVSSGLVPRSKNAANSKTKKRFTNMAMSCVGMLAKAVGVKLLPYTDRLVDQMFHSGLTPILIDALVQFSEHIPMVSSVIQERLLDSISGILIRPFLPVATPNQQPERIPFYGCPSSVQIKRTAVSAALAAKSRRNAELKDFDPSLIILALMTLHQFPFNYARQHALVGLLRNVVLTYLDDDVPYIRREAAITCAKLIPKIIESSARPHTTQMMFEVLKRLVIVGIADSVPAIRVTVLAALDAKIDKYLAQVEILSALFVALNDEVFQVREVVITLLGRLSARNPALVLPTLRRTLLQLLGELQQFHGNIDQEESSKLLGHLIGSSHQLIKPYVDPILNVLVPKLTDLGGYVVGPSGGHKDSHRSSGGGNVSGVGSGVASYVLSTLGKLSAICGEDMLRFLDGLLPLIIDALQDKSSSIKRQVALRTLGQLISSTGYVIEPVVKYPQLLPTILSVLRVERNSTMRVEVLKVLGVLGAIDPHKYRVSQLAYNREKLEASGGAAAGGRRDMNDGGMAPESSYNRYQNAGANAAQKSEEASAESEAIFRWQIQSPEDYYPTVAIAALMRILSDHRLSTHHNMVLHAVMFIFRSLGLKCVPFLPQIIPPFLREMRTCEDSLREAFLQHICSIVTIVKHHIRPYLEAIFQVCMDYWSPSNGLLGYILTLIEELVLALGEEFKTMLPAFIGNVMVVFQHDSSEHRDATTRVLHALRVVASAKGSLEDYLHILLPALVRLCESPDEVLHMRIATVHTISAIASTHDISEHASRIIHPFARILQSTNNTSLSAVSPTSAVGLTAPTNSAYSSLTPAHLYNECMEVLCKLILQLGFGYIVFEPIINRSLSRIGPSNNTKGGDKIESMQHLRYQRIVDRLLGKVQLVRDQLAAKADSKSALGLATASPAHQNLLISPDLESYHDFKLIAYTQGIEMNDLDDFPSSGDGTRVDGGGEKVSEEKQAGPDGVTVKKLHVSQQNLMKSWAASQRSTTDDWTVWMRGFSIELLKESPSSALRACSALAQKHPPLAAQLFNAAFLSCWTELYDQAQDDLIRSLETTFRSTHIPTEIMQTLLNICEFMERSDLPLPLDVRLLGDLAERCHAHAKALHYKEREFRTNPSGAIESLISINNKLGQADAARGMLEYANRYHREQVQETWYEKLQRWEDAVDAYEIKALENPNSVALTLGRMRCVRALGEWDRLQSLSRDIWNRCSAPQIRAQIAPLAAAGSLNLHQWDSLERYIGHMDENAVESAFYKAILCIHRNEFTQANSLIDKACEMLDSSLTALVGESYQRAYGTIVKVQQLMELQEVITFKTATEDKKVFIRKTWSQRLKGCQRSVDVWQEILSVRSLVVPPRDDIETWLDFSTLCRKSGRLHLSLQVLTNLLGMDPTLFVLHPDTPLPFDNPQMTLACLKHLYSAGYEKEAYNRLCDLVNSETLRPEVKRHGDHLTPTAIEKLKAACYLKLGTWQMEMLDLHFDSQEAMGHAKTAEYRREKQRKYAAVIPMVLNYFHAATVCDIQSFKAWHEWAMMNFRVVKFARRADSTTSSGSVHPVAMTKNIVSAIEGFFRSIWLQQGGDNSRQDVLRLLALWFEHGARKEVEAALAEGLFGATAENPRRQGCISIDTWLAVIPQIIARIHSPHAAIRNLLHELLSRIGRAHPQALVYPLTVASKSYSEVRKQAALNILNNMRQHSNNLVNQALLVSSELVRVAILWHELWHEAIEEASRYWFGQKNVEAMFEALAPLHAMMEKGPETMREVAFQAAFGRELLEAQECCRRYQASNRTNITYLNNAWAIYSECFRRMQRDIESSELELDDVSPKLLVANNMQLAVPGTYKVGTQPVCINFFKPTLKILPTKQHPRRLAIGGSDGLEYDFLLKGHEDLRQDERVMQLFGLVNTFLTIDRSTSKIDLGIARYAVVPLSPNSGLIEWVPACDTVHAVIKQYRDAKKIMLNVEQRLMMRMAPDYQHLTLIQKVECFEYTLNNTSGHDLRKALWLKSPSAEVWLDRRINFTRSLAVMSMVGYILGLGDRHPCLVEGSLVPTLNRGHVPVEQLTTADSLIGERGAVKLESPPVCRVVHPPSLSLSLRDAARQELYRISTPFGDYTVTGDHRLTIHWCKDAAPTPTLHSPSSRTGGGSRTPIAFTHMRIRWWTVDNAGTLKRHCQTHRIVCTDAQQQRGAHEDDQDEDEDETEVEERVSDDDDVRSSVAEDVVEQSQYLAMVHPSIVSVSAEPAAAVSLSPTGDLASSLSSSVTSNHAVKTHGVVTGTKRDLIQYFTAIRDELIAANSALSRPIRNDTLIEVSARSLFQHRALLLNGRGDSAPTVAVAWTPLGRISDKPSDIRPSAALDVASGDATRVSSECVQFRNASGSWQFKTSEHQLEVKVALQLHNPLTPEWNSMMTAEDRKPPTFGNIESVLSDTLKVDPSANIVAIELNPIASATGVMNLQLARYDRDALAGLQSALMLRAESIVAFGWFTRYRWEHDLAWLSTENLRVNAADIQTVTRYQHMVHGLRIPYSVLEDNSWKEYVTTVWFAPHPCKTHRIGEIGLALAAAFGKSDVEAKAIKATLRASLPRMTIEQMAITEPVRTYSLTVQGKLDTDRRHAIHGGILTHST